MASKVTPRGRDAQDTHNISGSKIQCIDCKTELNSVKVKSLKCDFCNYYFVSSVQYSNSPFSMKSGERKVVCGHVFTVE